MTMVCQLVFLFCSCLAWVWEAEGQPQPPSPPINVNNELELGTGIDDERDAMDVRTTVFVVECWGLGMMPLLR